MQSDQPLTKLSFDLVQTNKWEYMLFDATMAMAEQGEEGEEAAERLSKMASDAVASDHQDDDEKLLIDMPPSWVKRLNVARELFQARCPDGKKMTVFRKGLVEKFAPYSREDGLVEQVTVFKDAERTDIDEVRQSFSNRKDKLIKRTVRHSEAKTHEFFEPGRLDPGRGLKELIYIHGVRREFHFYASARLDGLIR